MKKSVKIILALLAIILLFSAFTAGRMIPRCSDNAMFYFVDPATGVNYLIYDPGYGAGGITPRFNRDGTLMVTKGLLLIVRKSVTLCYWLFCYFKNFLFIP